MLEPPQLLWLVPGRELPICVQWCVPAGGVVLDPELLDPELLDPELADADGDAEELGEDDADVVRVVVVPAELAPPLDASATPVAPAPSPAAIAPVMISRRTRLPALETIGLPPFPAGRGSWSACRQEACVVSLFGYRDNALRAL